MRKMRESRILKKCAAIKPQGRDTKKKGQERFIRQNRQRFSQSQDRNRVRIRGASNETGG